MTNMPIGLFPAIAEQACKAPTEFASSDADHLANLIKATSAIEPTRLPQSLKSLPTDHLGKLQSVSASDTSPAKATGTRLTSQRDPPAHSYACKLQASQCGYPLPQVLRLQVSTLKGDGARPQPLLAYLVALVPSHRVGLLLAAFITALQKATADCAQVRLGAAAAAMRCSPASCGRACGKTSTPSRSCCCLHVRRHDSFACDARRRNRGTVRLLLVPAVDQLLLMQWLSSCAPRHCHPGR